MEIQGFCEERFLPLKEAFASNFDAGQELGASFALSHRGKPTVDLWSGYADLAQTKPWAEDTIVFVASTAKIMVTLSTLMLIDRGSLDLDTPVAHYWPEFAQGGKAAVTVRDALTHQAGVPGFDPPIPHELQYDWDAVTARLASERHWFDGRRVLSYHVHTYGFVLGELVRRVDGRKPAQFFRDEVGRKLGVDFHPGLSNKADIARMAQVRMPTFDPTLLGPPDSLRARTLRFTSIADTLSWEYLSADLPSGLGFGNGRSIAKVAAIFATGGELDGERFLSPRTIEQIAEEQAYADDSFFGRMRWGLGVTIDCPEFPLPSRSCFQWGGMGGSWWMADPRAHVSCAYTPNNFSASMHGLDPRQKPFWRALGEILETL